MYICTNSEEKNKSMDINLRLDELKKSLGDYRKLNSVSELLEQFQTLDLSVEIPI